MDDPFSVYLPNVPSLPSTLNVAAGILTEDCYRDLGRTVGRKWRFSEDVHPVFRAKIKQFQQSLHDIDIALDVVSVEQPSEPPNVIVI